MLCSNCTHANDCVMFQFSGTEPPITACCKFKKKQQTNADRIRAMTDEELAVWIVNRTEGNDFDGYEEHVESWLDWLKQGVDDGD